MTHQLSGMSTRKLWSFEASGSLFLRWLPLFTRNSATRRIIFPIQFYKSTPTISQFEYEAPSSQELIFWAEMRGLSVATNPGMYNCTVMWRTYSSRMAIKTLTPSLVPIPTCHGESVPLCELLCGICPSNNLPTHQRISSTWLCCSSLHGKMVESSIGDSSAMKQIPQSWNCEGV